MIFPLSLQTKIATSRPIQIDGLDFEANAALQVAVKRSESNDCSAEIVASLLEVCSLRK